MFLSFSSTLHAPPLLAPRGFSPALLSRRRACRQREEGLKFTYLCADREKRGARGENDRGCSLSRCFSCSETLECDSAQTVTPEGKDHFRRKESLTPSRANGSRLSFRARPRARLPLPFPPFFYSTAAAATMPPRRGRPRAAPPARQQPPPRLTRVPIRR